ncbi:MAG: hypothetical protein KGI70_00190 [Patescibacteria group bacterium]|nr:hypothetical protein [Patescibacteria group bacterium]
MKKVLLLATAAAVALSLGNPAFAKHATKKAQPKQATIASVLTCPLSLGSAVVGAVFGSVNKVTRDPVTGTINSTIGSYRNCPA